MVAPRFSWVPSRKRSLGPDCIAFWRDAGGDLFDWQELVIDGILGLDEEDMFVTAEDALNVARQNGKGVILQAVEAFTAFELGYDVVMHTAHEFATSQVHQLRLEGMIQNAPHLHARVKGKGGYKHANGQESINLKSGSQIIFKARTSGGGRGYSADLLVWDEAMVIPDAVVGAQRPMLRASRARHGHKTIYAGSAVDQEVQQYGVNFARVRERGIAHAERVSLHEWSAPFDHPSEMSDEQLRDRSWWPQANPSMEEGLIAEETMAEEIASMPFRTAAVELGGVGDWPRTDGLGNMVISSEAWAALADRTSKVAAQRVFTFDVSPDRSRTAIGVTGRRKDGLLHTEIIEHKKGTGWVAARLAELKQAHSPEGILCDERSPAASLVPEIQELGVEVKVLDSQEYAQACGLFFDAVDQATLRHLGTPELASALRGASTRPLLDAWAWSRKNSSTDITPLVACTIGVWAVLTQAPVTPLLAFA